MHFNSWGTLEDAHVMTLASLPLHVVHVACHAESPEGKKSPKTKGDTLPVRNRNRSALKKANTCHQLDQGDLPMLYLPARIKFTSAEASAIVHIQCSAST